MSKPSPPLGRRTVRGARSLYCLGTLADQRSGGTSRCPSLEMRRYCLAMGTSYGGDVMATIAGRLRQEPRLTCDYYTANRRRIPPRRTVCQGDSLDSARLPAVSAFIGAECGQESKASNC